MRNWVPSLRTMSGPPRKLEDGVAYFRMHLDNRFGGWLAFRRGESSKHGSIGAGDDVDKATGVALLQYANIAARQDQAKRTKDELDDALGDLNRSTNRL